MKNIRTNQTGSSHLAILFAIIVLVAISAMGYKITSMSKTPANETAKVTTASSEPSTLSSKGDVEKANKELDSVPVDNDLDPAQLDSDLSSLQ